MKQYEYRLVQLMFDAKGDLTTPANNPANIDGLRPGERVVKVMGDPEYISSSEPSKQAWFLSVLLERETACFPVSSEADLDKLTAILKGELK